MDGVRPSSRRSHCLCVHRRRLSIVLEVTLRSRTLGGVGDPLNSKARGKDSERSKGLPGCDGQYIHRTDVGGAHAETTRRNGYDTRCRRMLSISR